MSRAVACLVLVLLTTTATRADPSVSFDTSGGDAWSAQLDLAGHASRCDEVMIEAPLGATRARRSGDRFHVRVVLRSGDNRIQAICSKRDRIVARSQPQLWRLRLPDEPKARIRVRAIDGSVLLDAGASEAAPAQPAPLVRFEWRARAGNPAPLRLADGRSLQTQEPIAGERLELASPERDGEYYVTLDISDADGRVDRSTGVFRIGQGRAQEVDLRSEHPAWLDGAVVYGAAPYFFQPATFRGVAARLHAIAALGATVLWLSPVTMAAPGDFGYAVADQFQLREQFGGEQEFRALVAAAHRAGLRVLVDFVPNHLSVDSAYFQHMASNGARSPYYRWFDRDSVGEITHYFDWRHLANLDFDNPQVRAYVTAAMRRLVRDFEVDGFRVDASWAVARRAPEFWPQLRAELKRVDPDIVLLAEASAREPYTFANGFDAAYDWTSQLGEWSWRAAFAEPGRVNLDELRAALAQEGASHARNGLIMRFLNNNDTGPRFITRFGLPRTKVAATLLFTLPGIPLIYNGDEAGAAFEPYDEGPRIAWNDGGELALHYRELTALRRQEAALRSSMLQLLRTDADEKVVAYLRPAASRADDILVLLNFSAETLTVGAADAATRATLQRFRRGRFQLAPYATLVLSAE
jgi:cyclomaltodextrinase